MGVEILQTVAILSVNILCKTDTKHQKALRFRAVFVFQIQKSKLFLIFVYIKLLSYMEACKWNQLSLCYV